MSAKFSEFDFMILCCLSLVVNQYHLYFSLVHLDVDNINWLPYDVWRNVITDKPVSMKK